MAVNGESLGRLFVELGLADDQFLSGVKNALQEVGRLRDGVVKAGKQAADGIKPIADAFVNVTDTEKKAAAAVRQHAETEQKRAATLGLTIAQLREMDRALKAIAAAEQKARETAEALTAAENKAREAAAAAVNAGIKPLATAFANVSEAQKRAVAQMIAGEAREKARAQALGVTIAQLRELDRAQKAATDSAAKQKASAEAVAKAEREAAAATAAQAAATQASARARMTVSGGLAADRTARGVGGPDFGSAPGVVTVATPDRTAEQVGQLAALGVAISGVTGVLRESITAASNYSNAFSGLRSVAESFGQDADRAVKAAEDLAADGLLPAGAAAQAFKNALASGYSIEESIKLLEGLKEQAIFNRQAHYDLGGAIIATTEGIKNEQSILADATGTTTNLSQMWKEYAEQLGKAPGQLSAAEKRQAAYNGFLKETARSAGDLAKAQDTLAGSIAKSETASKKAQVALGEALAPAYRGFLEVLSKVAEAFTVIAERFPGLTAGIASTVIALGTMATALSAARTAALLFQTSLGPVGLALAAISVAMGVAVAAYTGFADASKEAADAQNELRDALADTGHEAALKRQALAMEALAEAERELNDTQDGFSTASQKEVAVLKAKADARRRELIAANEAVRVEKDLADERARLKAQTDATGEAEKKLADLREENMDEPARLEAEMNRVLNSMGKATPDVLEGIREEYLKKIAAAQAKAAKDGESAAKKLQSQIDAAKKSVRDLIDLADEANRNAETVRAEANGQDPAIAELESRLRIVAAATAEAIEDAQAITDAKARAAAIAAATSAGEAAREAIVREWTTNGEVQAEAEAKAYRERAALHRQKTVDLLNKIDTARMSESERLAAERDAVLAGYDATEAEKLAITAYYNEQIAKADEDLKKKRIAKVRELRDAYFNAFSDIVSRIDSAASSIMDRHREQMELVQAQLDAASTGEEKLTDSQKKELDQRYAQQRAAYLRAFYVQKAAAIASIAVSTAQAVMATYAALAAVPPVAVAAAAAVGALGAVQIGLVASEQPQFEKGGVVTEEDRRRSPGTARGASVNADLHVGEGVLTAQRGMAAVGGEAGLRLLNMGIPVGTAARVAGGRVQGGGVPPQFAGPPPSVRMGMEGPVNIRMELDGRVVDDVQVRRWEDGSSKVKNKVYRTSGVRVGLDR